jgi:hypothetical protein
MVFAPKSTDRANTTHENSGMLADVDKPSVCPCHDDKTAVCAQVTLQAVVVDVEPLFDTLAVESGDGALLAMVGSPQKLTLIQEGTLPMRLKFASDASFRYKGFFIEYVTEPPPVLTAAEQGYDVSFTLFVTGEQYLSTAPHALCRHHICINLYSGPLPFDSDKASLSWITCHHQCKQSV